MNNKPDEPACREENNRSKHWYLNGKRHRTDGPALEYPDGEKRWFLNGKLHRTDGPAVERPDGVKHWYLDDKLHRTDGPAIERDDETKSWYLFGRRYEDLELWRVTSEIFAYLFPKFENGFRN